MSNSGIMKQITELLLQGKSSRELIDMGYRPGSVYGTMRSMKRKGTVTAGHGLRPAASRARTPTKAIGEDGLPERQFWHVDPPLTCPGCEKKVKHWEVCPRCDCVAPLGCACAEGSPGFGKVYSLSELITGVNGRSLRIAEI
jgi:hypothetical protein